MAMMNVTSAITAEVANTTFPVTNTTFPANNTTFPATNAIFPANNTTFPATNTTFPDNMEAVVWTMPLAATVIAIIYMSLNLLIGAMSNCLLIVIINHSPTLKTPANSHLLNICANNLVLCIGMLLSLLSMLLTENMAHKINILTGIHVFILSNCFFQYWGTFASIGYYRSKIIQNPSLSIKRRRQTIARCLATSWATSLLISLMICLSHIEQDVYSCMTLNPFQKHFILCGTEHEYSAQRLGIVVISIAVFLMKLAIIVTSYHKVFKALNSCNPFGRNRVSPIAKSFTSSLPSLGDAVTVTQTEANGCQTDKAAYTISRRDFKTDGEFLVHYQRNDSINMLTFEDIIALENPILATHMRKQTLQKRPLQLTRSTASNNSVKSRCPEFTDISATADLKRFQNLKNNSALRNHFLRRDRVGFNSATRNSLVMLASFIVCSLPMFVCIIPHVLSHNKERHRVLILLFTQLTFYLNSPIYPLWYLIQNKRVRKSLIRVYESLCIKLNIRR